MVTSANDGLRKYYKSLEWWSQTLSGTEFQEIGSPTEKAWWPNVVCQYHGTVK